MNCMLRSSLGASDGTITIASVSETPKFTAIPPRCRNSSSLAIFFLQCDRLSFVISVSSLHLTPLRLASDISFHNQSMFEPTVGKIASVTQFAELLAFLKKPITAFRLFS